MSQKEEEEGLYKIISGLKTEIIKLEGEMPVVHVQFPPGTSKDRSSAFAQAMRQEFPADVKIVFTTPGVKIDVHRPRVVNLTITDCEVTVKDIENRISHLFKEEIDIINIRIHNVKWKKNSTRKKRLEN
jgi:hypothetical protein